MNRILIISFLLLSVTKNAYTQDKTPLNKYQTIEYLQKKLAEIVGFTRSIPTGKGSETVLRYYLTMSCDLNDGKISIVTERSNYNKLMYQKNVALAAGLGYREVGRCDFVLEKFTDIFNPAHIVTIEDDQSISSGNPVGLLKIVLKSNTGMNKFRVYELKNEINDQWNTRYAGLCHTLYVSREKDEAQKVVVLPYLKSDDTNFNKLKKAFEHLRDLFKAEDDPFGE